MMLPPLPSVLKKIAAFEELNLMAARATLEHPELEGGEVWKWAVQYLADHSEKKVQK